MNCQCTVAIDESFVESVLTHRICRIEQFISQCTVAIDDRIVLSEPEEGNETCSTANPPMLPWKCFLGVLKIDHRGRFRSSFELLSCPEIFIFQTLVKDY